MGRWMSCRRVHVKRGRYRVARGGGTGRSGDGASVARLHAFDKYTELKTTWLRIDAA